MYPPTNAYYKQPLLERPTSYYYPPITHEDYQDPMNTRTPFTVTPVTPSSKRPYKAKIWQPKTVKLSETSSHHNQEKLHNHHLPKYRPATPQSPPSDLNSNFKSI
jgi:hypothetical protein